MDPQAICAGVRRGDLAAEEALYRLVMQQRGRLRSLFPRLRAEYEDTLHDLYLNAYAAIRRGDVHDLGALIRTILWRMSLELVNEGRKTVREFGPCIDPSPSPYERLCEAEREAMAHRAIASLTGEHDGEVLERRLRGEEPSEIKRALGISDTCHRLAQWRAKAQATARYARLERMRPVRAVDLAA